MSWKEDAQDCIKRLCLMRDILDDDISEIKDAIEANDEMSFSEIAQAYEDR